MTQQATTWWQRYRTYKSQLDSAQKPGNGVPAYTRWINRRGARIVAAGGAAAGLTPNHITAISAMLSLVGMVLLVVLPPSPLQAVGVAVFFALGYLCDSADGQLARLTNASSPAGEWLDHVVDAFRSPAIHLTAAIATILYRPEYWWVATAALAYALVTSGQFLSQILAEAFVKKSGRAQRRGTNLTSFILLPTDPGTLCWSFVLWAFPTLFSVWYVGLALLAILHSAASLRRRYADMVALSATK